MAGAVVWLTGIPGSGKTTLADALYARLSELGIQSYVLDGDRLRGGLCSGLGLDKESRVENVRRTYEVALLMAQAGLVAVCAIISPYASGREDARKRIEDSGKPFFEIHVDCPVEVCRKRDPKGLYEKHRRGDIKGLTGVDAPYEPPIGLHLRLRTDLQDVDKCVNRIVSFIIQSDGWHMDMTPGEMIRF